MHKEGDSSGKHSVEEEEKDSRGHKRQDKVEKPLKVKIPKHKTSFTVIGTSRSFMNSFSLQFLTYLQVPLSSLMLTMITSSLSGEGHTVL